VASSRRVSSFSALSTLEQLIPQISFANRVRVLSGRWLITLICWALTFARGAFAVASFVVIFQAPNVSRFETQFQWLVSAAFGIAAGVDILVSGSQCYYLWKMRVNGMEKRV
jgi:hypothetical protein